MRRDHWFYFANVPRFVRSLEPTLTDLQSENDLSFDVHRRRRLIVGSPQDCIEQIEECRELLGITYLILSFRQSSGPSYEQELECLRRFGAEVIPAFT